MTIKKILNKNIPRLKKISDTPQLDAEVLLSYALKKPKEWLYARPEYELTRAEIKKIKSYLTRRLKHEPIAYITGHKEFYGLDFYVNKHVLIPRPETEELVEQVLQHLHKTGQSSALITLTIADIGTGSGCIAISLAKSLPKAKIYATDISKRALAVAKKNAKKHKVRVRFLHGNLLTPLSEKVDIIVANLPYLSEKVYNKTSPGIKKYEPKKALIAPDNGLCFYKKLLKQAPKYLKPNGKIFLELGNDCSSKTFTGQDFI